MHNLISVRNLRACWNAFIHTLSMFCHLTGGGGGGGYSQIESLWGCAAMFFHSRLQCRVNIWSNSKSVWIFSEICQKKLHCRVQNTPKLCVKNLNLTQILRPKFCQDFQVPATVKIPVKMICHCSNSCEKSQTVSCAYMVKKRQK